MLPIIIQFQEKYPMSFKSASNNFTFSSVSGKSGRRGGPMVTPSIVNKCLAIVIGEPIVL